MNLKNYIIICALNRIFHWHFSCLIVHLIPQCYLLIHLKISVFTHSALCYYCNNCTRLTLTTILYIGKLTMTESLKKYGAGEKIVLCRRSAAVRGARRCQSENGVYEKSTVVKASINAAWSRIAVTFRVGGFRVRLKRI